MLERGYSWKSRAQSLARSDDARPFGHNTATLAVLITLQGYR